MALEVPLTRNGGEYRMSSTPIRKSDPAGIGGCREAGTAGKIEVCESPEMASLRTKPV